MNCSEFIEAFSDYRDGVAPPDVASAVRRHIDECSPCGKYERVLEVGVGALRRGRALRIPEDFNARLRHRLFHVEDDEALRTQSRSGASAVAVLAIAAVLAAVAWSPLLRPRAPTVELAPIVVSEPSPPVFVRPVNAYPFGDEPLSFRQGASRADLWDGAHAMLFRSSSLFRRYRQGAALHQAGVDREP